VDLSRYGGIADMYVDYVRVYSSAPKETVIDNLHPRRDTEGNIIDAHDGNILKAGSKFYWYGTAYGNTSGFLRSNYFQSYSSTDLTTWKKESPLLADAASGIYYRPHVIYNPATRKYVLWFNWYPKLWDGRYGVAVADNPAGPFRIVDSDVRVRNADHGVGDMRFSSMRTTPPISRIIPLTAIRALSRG
jgi:hypothetical protein